MRVAILGCGPAGLLAAHAAHLMRVDCDILSIVEQSVISGAQFLHEPIPQLTESPNGHITTFKMGTAAGYAQKVYGDPQAQVSWDVMQAGERPAWSLREAYDTLWHMYSPMVENLQVDATTVEYLMKRYDLVISTVPAMSICANIKHTFPSQKVYFKSECYANVLPEEAHHSGSFILYNGVMDYSWYRTSSLFGFPSTEFSAVSSERPPDAVRSGIKPLHTDCDCHPGLIRVGRYGRWRKGVLTHHAFQEASHALQRL